MPIFEYTCRICSEDFEKLVFGSQEVCCPKCSSTEVKKKFSVFCSTGTDRPLAGTAASGCTSCSKTSCSTCK
ncbi:MAG: FmdB family zinc ribbon protein [Nitrospirota bacterium]